MTSWQDFNPKRLVSLCVLHERTKQNTFLMISYFVILANFIQRNPDVIANQFYTMHTRGITTNIVNCTFSIENEALAWTNFSLTL